MSGGAAAAVRRAGFGAHAVLERDFLVLTSNGRFVALRTALVALVATIVAVVLLTFENSRSWRSPSPDEVGRAIFAAFVIAYPALVQLVGPALAAASVSGERSQETLHLVLAAPVSPYGFVLAKFVSRLGALLIPLLGGLPIAGLAFLYGGVSFGLFGAWALVVLALAVQCVSASVLASAWSRTVATSLTASYFLGLALPWLWSLAMWGVAHEWLELPSPNLLTGHTPWAALDAVGSATFGGGRVTVTLVPFLVATALVSALALLLAGARLSRESSAMAAGGPRRGRRRRAWFSNPVLDRAINALPGFRGGLGAWFTLAVVGGLAWMIPLANRLDDDEIVAGLNLATWAVFFVVLSRSSQSFVGERQQGSLAVLRTTPIRPGEMVAGKLGGLAAQAAVLLLPAAALVVVGAVAREVELATLITWGGASASMLFLAANFGLRISATATTAGRAAARAFGIAFGAMIAHGLMLAMVAGLTRHFDEKVMAPLAAASPPVAVGMLTWAPNENSVSGSEAAWYVWSGLWLLAYAAGGVLLGRLTAARLGDTE